MIEWLTGTVAGKMISTFFLSMLPVGELRIGLPFGIAVGLDLPQVLLASIVGNMIPVPFIIVYINMVFHWMRKHIGWLDSFITRLERNAGVKSEKVQKYGPWGLLLFVAIPLPGTGAWTGSLIAALLDLSPKRAVPVIFIGVCVAAVIVTLLTLGVIHLF